MGETPAGTAAPPSVPDPPGPPIGRQVLALALPALAQQYLHLLVRLSDQTIAAEFPVPEADRANYLSALTTAGYLYWCVSGYTILVSVGATALVARFVGAGNRAGACHATGQAVLLGLLFGIGGSAAGLLWLPSLIAAVGPPGSAAGYCLTFLTPLAALLAFQLTESACVACLVGAGDTRTGLYVLGGVAVLNVPLAWGLCFGVGPVPGLGFVGIALGTGLSHLIGCLTVLVLLARGRSGLRLRPADLVPDRQLLRRMLRVSLPAGVDSLSVAVSQLWFLSLVNALPTISSAAHGIAIQVEALGYLAGAAFGTAGMSLVGRNLGALNPARAARCGWTAFALGGAVMTAMGGLFFALAPLLFRFFGRDPAVVAAGVPVLRLVAFAMPALASQIIFLYALRGAGDTRVPVLFNWVGFLGVRIPLAYLLTRPMIDLGPVSVPGFDLGLLGAWVAMVADIWVRGTFFAARFAGGRWKTVEV
ncbi:MAG: mepA [Gemmataceae bacterium]|nr:mepA [Gemmataceae bacterium]